MTINVDLEDVPFAILEMVKERILASRRKAGEQQQRPTPSTRPRPQQRKFGASTSRWVRPHPAAVRLDLTQIGHAVNAETSTTEVVSTLLAQQWNTGGLIKPQQIGTLPSIGWMLRSGDWNQSITYSAATSVPSLPTATWNYSTSLKTGQVRRVVITFRVFRAGSTSNCTENGITYPAGNFVQEYGTITTVDLTGLNGVALTDDIINQAGGLGQSYDSQFDALIAAAPPMPPCHFSSNVYSEETERSESTVTVTIAGQYIVNWSNTALLAANSSLQTRSFVLPAGGDACIVVMMQRYSHAYITKAYSGSYEVYESPHTMTQAAIPWPPTSGTPLSIRATVINKAYICTQRAVREITTIPAPLTAILNVLNPPFTYSSALGGSVSYPDYEPIGSVTNGGDYFFSIDTTLTWTPSVFASLNAIRQFIAPSALRSFAPSKRPILTDFRFGYYAESTADRNLYYASWIGDRDNIDPEQIGNMQRLQSQLVSVPQNPGSIVPGFNLNAIWDWDDPIYCRSMCSALGFSSADLLP